MIQSLIIIKIFLLMMLCHIIDDFVLQPVCLSKLKQKSWWISECQKENVEIDKYCNDYRMALAMHSMSWSTMILLPWIILSSTVNPVALLLMWLFNAVVHYWVDDLKANHYSINLVTDQLVHACQIILTFTILVCFS